MELAKRKVIVKRLAAIHDLGAMDVLCTDKTGTLTEATIELVRTIDGRGAESERAYAYACLNSHFESGMKSPLDEAILAAASVRHDAAGRRSTRCRSTSSGVVSLFWSSTTAGVA